MTDGVVTFDAYTVCAVGVVAYVVVGIVGITAAPLLLALLV